MFGSTQEALVETIEGQAIWRYSVAERFPEDERNLASAQALNKLAQYVEAWSSDDPRLRDWADTMIDGDDDLISLEEEANRLLGRHGFGPSMEQDEMLREVLRLTRQETDGPDDKPYIRLVK